MNAIGKIIAIAGLGFWLGSAVFFGYLNGPLVGVSTLVLPLPALFGWYYFPLVLLFVFLLWFGYTERLIGLAHRVLFIALGGLLGGVTTFFAHARAGRQSRKRSFCSSGRCYRPTQHYIDYYLDAAWLRLKQRWSQR